MKSSSFFRISRKYKKGILKWILELLNESLEEEQEPINILEFPAFLQRCRFLLLSVAS